MEAPREVRGESEWVMKVTDKLGQRERGCYSVGEQTQWVVGMADKWGGGGHLEGKCTA